jgi:hypothetical protein
MIVPTTGSEAMIARSTPARTVLRRAEADSPGSTALADRRQVLATLRANWPRLPGSPPRLAPERAALRPADHGTPPPVMPAPQVSANDSYSTVSIASCLPSSGRGLVTCSGIARLHCARRDEDYQHENATARSDAHCVTVTGRAV